MPRLLLAAAAAVLFAPAAFAEDKPTADRLLGQWKLTKSAQELPPGASASLDIKKDGKFTMTIEFGGQKHELPGTWKLDANKLTITQKGADGKDKTEVMTVKTLTADKLETVDEKDKTDEFTRVKK